MNQPDFGGGFRKGRRNNMGFGQNLQCIRTRNGLTQEQLAEELNVTRQSVSKWESGASFPEMETLLKICERYKVNLDELMRGSLKEHNEEEAESFIRHIKVFSIQMALSVSAIIMALAVISLFDGIARDNLMGAFFLAVVAASVITMIVSGMEHDRFVKKHPKMQPVFSDKEIERADHIFSWAIAGGVGLILIGLIISSCLDDTYDSLIFTNVPGTAFLAAVSLAVGIFIFFGIRRGMYHVEEYNKENVHLTVPSKTNKKVGAACGVIMLIATCVFLIWGFWGMPGGMYTGNWRDYAGHWGISWIAFPIGGILCGIASIIIKAFGDKEKDQNGNENENTLNK